MARKTLESLGYYEARNWFWIRTAIWFAPAAIVSVMAHFAYASGVFDQFSERFIASMSSGVCSVLLGILAGYVSMQLTWMRYGWRISFVLNGPACLLMAVLMALMLCGLVSTFIQSNPPDPVGHKAAYEAFLAANDRAFQMMAFSIGASAFWGFVFGSWFAMRRDKYFIEPITG